MPTVTMCQICLWRIDDGQSIQICPECQTPYHASCWEELGGCAVYGCALMVEIKKAENEIVTIWGEREKSCPMCAEKIPVESLECPLCHTPFNDIRPVERDEFLRQSEDSEIAGYRRKAVWLLVFSLFGCSSPLALLIGGIWYVRKKQEIERAGANVKGLVLIALLVSIAYLVLAGFGMLVFSLKGEQV